MAPVWIPAAGFDGVPLTANDGLGSCHTADVPFVFGTTGDPGWPQYDAGIRATALLGDEPDVVSDPQQETRLAG